MEEEHKNRILEWIEKSKQRREQYQQELQERDEKDKEYKQKIKAEGYTHERIQNWFDEWVKLP